MTDLWSRAMLRETTTKASKAYTRRTAVTMSVYLVLVVVTTYVVRHLHVNGWLLYVCAVLPSVAIFRQLYVVGMYLSEERDEYLRQQAVQSILWATAAVLGLTAFTDFLRSYTPFGTLPPFTVFVTFWVVYALAQYILVRMNRVPADE
jgi:hypothetical protein